MVKHVVFFCLLDAAEGKTKLENAQIIKNELEGLKHVVPGLKTAFVGINIPNAAKTDHDICLECTFDSWEDLNIYANHPEHLKVAAYIGKCKSGRAAVDYEY
ncbi:MAG: Dabb family protein [Paludibacter sp.]|nr:Dabb family protein [Bacteroidales bacterium]MCM1068404.1 Dabb family protein [Prevotella sp.]MCM1353359.1 Dabb family protein [Bacteroides sp.]MCM1442520.1 Dabb family protein [Muribaculum sp.]MCM1481365.1 Dabb family protein [Paludibacter sp.]